MIKRFTQYGLKINESKIFLLICSWLHITKDRNIKKSLWKKMVSLSWAKLWSMTISYTDVAKVHITLCVYEIEINGFSFPPQNKLWLVFGLNPFSLIRRRIGVIYLFFGNFLICTLKILYRRKLKKILQELVLSCYLELFQYLKPISNLKVHITLLFLQF